LGAGRQAGQFYPLPSDYSVQLGFLQERERSTVARAQTGVAETVEPQPSLRRARGGVSAGGPSRPGAPAPARGAVQRPIPGDPGTVSASSTKQGKVIIMDLPPGVAGSSPPPAPSVKSNPDVFGGLQAELRGFGDFV
jgi:hypothetical protein